MEKYDAVKHEIFNKIFNNPIIQEEINKCAEYSGREDYIVMSVSETTNEIIKILNDVFGDN